MGFVRGTMYGDEIGLQDPCGGAPSGSHGITLANPADIENIHALQTL
jgi:hypothetical protein